MMFKDTLLSGQLQDFVGKQATIRGWLHTVRAVSANLAFLIIRDRDGFTKNWMVREKDIIEVL
jgi:aspartyl/asparaginyl-tRNA synthetase